MITIKKYEASCENEWNECVVNSKNATFLFNRNYMEYHSSRFTDFSLLIYKKEKLVALFPANILDNVIYSHQGLTYGGLLYSNKLSLVDILVIFEAIIQFYKKINIKEIIYKAIPYIYSAYPAQEDLYALFKSQAELIGCNISSTVPLNKRLKFIESRKCGTRKARRNNIIYEFSEDYHSFWHILSDTLDTKYHVEPTHSLEEIKYLHSLFPQNIKLYIVKKDYDILGGALLYIYNSIVHVQYISANFEGKELGALDLLFDYLINEQYKDFDYFDFGQSTEQMGNFLNENLLFQKEGFGGRGVVYNIFKIQL